MLLRYRTQVLLMFLVTTVLINETCLANSNCKYGYNQLCRLENVKEKFTGFMNNRNVFGKLVKRSAEYSEYPQYPQYVFRGENSIPREKTLMHKIIVIPTLLGHFLGTIPMRIPGMPYHIDTGSPDHYPYRPVSSFYLGD